MPPTLSLEEIYAPIESRLRKVQGALADILASPNRLAGEVIGYFLSGRGKLLRPALVFLGAEMAGFDPEKEPALMKLGAAVEIFHSATLIHDDIVDGASLRRRQPTVHEKWTPQVAVLVGDYLHDRAMRVVYETRCEALYGLFLDTAGEVLDGEIREIQDRRNFELSEAGYLEIVDRKTAALIACALACGARFAGAGDREVSALQRFGRAFGTAFQIIDDCLDFTGAENEFGKTLGADCEAGVLTLPVIYLLSVLGHDEKKRLRAVLEPGPKGPRWHELLKQLHSRGAIDYARRKALEYGVSARKELAVFPESPAKKSLNQLFDYILERDR